MTPKTPTTRMAAVLLVDQRGWVLLQERDAHAPREPGRWGLPGGRPGPEESFEDAAYRGLAEKTGLVLERGHLYLWRDQEVIAADTDEPSRHHVYVARVDVGDADLVSREGSRIVFVDPARLGELDLGEAAAHFVPAFLESSTYARLAGADPAGAPQM